MRPMPFSATVRPGDAGWVIELIGDIDRSAEEGLDGAYAAAHGEGPLLLDFSGTGYINSTGIALIVGLLAKARADRRELAAFGLSDHYREIFSITRLVDFMKMYEDEQDAVATAAAKGAGEHA